MNQKVEIFRSKKYTDAAKGQICIRCGTLDGTVCARHYNGLRQHIYGKGRGIKASDLVTADLCMECDARFGEGTMEGFVNMEDRSEEFQHWCIMTIMRRVEQGILKVK